MRRLFGSLRMRLALLFTGGVAAVVLVSSMATFYHLREEVIEEKANIEHPGQKDYVLHGRFDSDDEINEIMRDLVWKTLEFAGPLLIIVVALGWYLAKRSLQPIVELNKQLHDIGAKNLKPNLSLKEADGEFQEHVENLNRLLSRLGKSFDDLSEYAAKVAHELRTPITILRLKVEKEENEISPELREELTNELERISHVVDQSLLIAKAERGSVIWDEISFDLAEMVRDVVDDFSMLAAEEAREFVLNAPEKCGIVSDPSYVKQILHGYLNNALKHGDGAIEVSLEADKESARLNIINSQSFQKGKHKAALGLGLRVIAALVASQNRLRTEAGFDGNLHSVLMEFPFHGKY
jgi:signal transduction histidine kinase